MRKLTLIERIKRFFHKCEPLDDGFSVKVFDAWCKYGLAVDIGFDREVKIVRCKCGNIGEKRHGYIIWKNL